MGLLSRATIEQELALKRLAVLDIEDFPIMRHWYVVHRRGKRLSAPAQKFKEFLKKEARSIIRDGDSKDDTSRRRNGSSAQKRAKRQSRDIRSAR